METQSNKWLKLKRRLKELIAAVAASHHPMKVVKVIMIVAAVRKTMIVRMTMKMKITMRIKMISQQEMMLITIRIK